MIKSPCVLLNEHIGALLCLVATYAAAMYSEKSLRVAAAARLLGDIGKPLSNPLDKLRLSIGSPRASPWTFHYTFPRAWAPRRCSQAPHDV